MLKALPYGLVFTLCAALGAGIVSGGALAWATPLIVFLMIPLADAVMGRQEDNTPPDDSWLYDAWLVAWVPAQLLMIVATLHAVVAGRPPLEALGLVVSCGVMGGLGINIAHELMHRKAPLMRGLAEVLMTSVTYSHFCVEHVLGHHKHVATDLDPATSRLGESVYRFLPRTIIGGVRSAWRLETARVNKQSIPLGLRDRRVRYVLILATVYSAIWVAGGVVAVAAFAGQSLVAIALLEVINYIEHYGLRRREVSPGRYERVQPHHSWNAPYQVSNWYLFNLARHADHHYLASRPYPTLRHFDDAPQLPAGYGTMFVLSLVPPLWHRVMDDRARAARGRTTLPKTHHPRDAVIA